MPKKRKRVGLRLIKKVLLLLVVLLVSCDGTVFHRFETVDDSGWALGDTLSFVYDGSVMAAAGTGLEYSLQVRYGAGYIYKNLCVRIESWRMADGVLLSVDTLCCPMYDERGRRLGSTAGTMYQNSSQAQPVAASPADTLLLKVSHIMATDSLQDVFDVGVRLNAVKI